MWEGEIITSYHIKSFSPFCVSVPNSAVAQNGAVRKRLPLFSFLFFALLWTGLLSCLTAATQESNRWRGERMRRKTLPKTSPAPPVVPWKRGITLKKLSSSHPGLPPSCPAACTAQMLKSRSRRRTTVHGERSPGAAWRSRGGEVAGHPAAGRARCPPARAEKARTSLLVGSWEECCCWSLERWKSLHPGCSAGSHLLDETEAPGESWVVGGQGLTGGAPALGGAGCCRWPKTQTWRRSACLNPWWCPSSVWFCGFGTTPSPAKANTVCQRWSQQKCYEKNWEMILPRLKE